MSWKSASGGSRRHYAGSTDRKRRFLVGPEAEEIDGKMKQFTGGGQYQSVPPLNGSLPVNPLMAAQERHVHHLPEGGSPCFNGNFIGYAGRRDPSEELPYLQG